MIVAGGTIALLLLCLSLAVAVLPVLLALPPMALGLGVWLLFRRLDAPRKPRPTRPPLRHVVLAFPSGGPGLGSGVPTRRRR